MTNSKAIRERETELWHMREALKGYETELSTARAECERLRELLCNRCKRSCPHLCATPPSIEDVEDERDSLRAQLAEAHFVLRWLDEGGGLGRDVHQRIRAALRPTPNPPASEGSE